MVQHERVQPGMCLHLEQPRGAFLSQAVGFFVIAFIAFCTLAVFFAAFFIAIAFRGSIQIMDPTKITQTNPQHIVAVATAIRPTSRMYIYIYHGGHIVNMAFIAFFDAAAGFPFLPFALACMDGARQGVQGNKGAYTTQS